VVRRVQHVHLARCEDRRGGRGAGDGRTKECSEEASRGAQEGKRTRCWGESGREWYFRTEEGCWSWRGRQTKWDGKGGEYGYETTSESEDVEYDADEG
jgi:hypothetical protein